jgi:hypothetical protein
VHQQHKACATTAKQKTIALPLGPAPLTIRPSMSKLPKKPMDIAAHNAAGHEWASRHISDKATQNDKESVARLSAPVLWDGS